MVNTRKIVMLKNTEFTAANIIAEGQSEVDEAIHLLGRIIDRSTCRVTIQTCERLIEALNDGPDSLKVNELTEEQVHFASKVLSAVYDCVTLRV